MLNRKLTLVLSLALVSVLMKVSFSQTTQFKLTWDKNSEDDMYQYIVYKDTSPAPETEIATVNHPETVYEDSDIEKGVLYHYRLKARDFSQNTSGFSSEVSAAIPKIDFPASIRNKLLKAGQNFDITLDDYVNDPDDNPTNLQWKVSGYSALTVQLDNVSHIVSISAPANWKDTNETLQFSVTDPDNFVDIATVAVFSDSSQIPVETVDEIYAFPIPYRPEKHASSNGITFTNLGSNASLVIYNLLGEPVFKESGLSNSYIWNVKNGSDRDVNSGLYLYHIKSRGKTSIGKLVIVR